MLARSLNKQQAFILALGFAWLAALVLLPGLIAFRISLSDAAIAQPPYVPQFSSFNDISSFIAALDFDIYRQIFSDNLYIDSYLASLRLAFISTAIALLVGYPLALAMARSDERIRPLLLTLLIVPFWSSFLIRIYAWIGILKDNGFLNNFLLWLGVIQEPLVILNTEIAVVIGIVYAYLPFMVLPIYAALDKLDPSLLEAAADLGCPPWRRFFKVTLPLTLRGVIAGAALVFIPVIGEFVIPDLLGGSDTLMIGHMLWVDFFSNRDWPLASAVAMIMLITILVPFILLRKNLSESGGL